MKKLIKFNNNIRSFSAEAVPDDSEDNAPPEGIPEQPDEPIDYLNGIPATVLDLKDPIFDYNPKDLASQVNEEVKSDPEFNNYLNEWNENYKDVISNLNKESAISHRLNELGSTNYDFTGEGTRWEGSGGLRLLRSSNADANSDDKDEIINVGAINIPEKYKDEDIDMDLSYRTDLGNIVSHELAHLNDPSLDETVSYGGDYTDGRLRNEYGNKFTDAYNRFKIPSDSEDTKYTLFHDQTPFEVYADAASMRSALFKSGAWNGKDPITEDMVDRYLKSEHEFLNSVKNGNYDFYPENPDINYGSSPQRLDNYFDRSDLVNILNSQRRYSISSDSKVKIFSDDPPEEDTESTSSNWIDKISSFINSYLNNGSKLDKVDEPTDYLKGIPATVMDLKDPVFKESRYLDSRINSVINTDFPKYKEYGIEPESLESYKENSHDVISNLNKESAINRRLNELGSTDYDLTGEYTREDNGSTYGIGDLTEHASSRSNDRNEYEYMNITSFAPKHQYRTDLGETISHELGHLNDPYLSTEGHKSYGGELTDDEVMDAYGERFADAYRNFVPKGSNEIAADHDKNPFEVYADAAALRSNLFKSGIWNGKDQITEDMVNNYLKSEYDFRDAVGATNDWYPKDPELNFGTSSQRLANYFNTPDVVKLLNSSRKFSIKYDPSTKSFSTESDPPSDWISGLKDALSNYLNNTNSEESDTPDEPTDYLKGTPATVLDLKKPVFEFDPGNPTFGSDMDGYVNRTDANKVKDIVSDLNKESAINRRLNELGATDYDLSGEGSRRVVIDSKGALADSGAASNPVNWLETMFTGYNKKYNIDPKLSQDDVYAHELGHMNDPDQSRWKKLGYGDKITDSDVKERYGDEFTEAYKNYHGNSISEIHDHTPFEVYADAAAMRSALFKSGAWDGNSQITPSMITDYLNSEHEFLNNMTDGHYKWGTLGYGSPSQRLETQFDTNDIAKILNSSRRYSYTDEELQAKVADDDLTVDTKEFIGTIEPNKPFHNRSTFNDKTLFR